MVSIKKIGFASQYYLTEEGMIYNIKTKRFIKPYRDHCFKLKSDCGQLKTVSLRSLYKKVYGKLFCIDNIKDLQDEVWKPIAGTNEYFVSNKARIKSYKGYESKLLKVWLNKKENGYYVVKLTIDGITKNYSLHRLVAEAFVQKPKQNINAYQLHHKDFNRLNNNAQNLQWLSKEKHKEIHDKKVSI